MSLRVKLALALIVTGLIGVGIVAFLVQRLTSREFDHYVQEQQLAAFADQMALPVPDYLRAQPGVSWIRLATDMPTAAVEFIHRQLDFRSYLRSLRMSNIESVFSRDDVVPALAEVALLPYLAWKRGF